MNDVEIISKIKDCKVLYVEDDSFQMEQTLLILSIFFNNIRTSNNAEDALEIFKKEKIDLIICDVILPVMSGIDLIKIIKSIKEDINVIFISSTTNLKDFRKAIQMQVLDFLIKPYSFNELQKTLLEFGRKNIQSNNIVRINDQILYDNLKCCVIVDNKEIVLTINEQKILELACKFKEKVLTYEEISMYLGQKKVNVIALKNIIFRFRKKVQKDLFVNIMGMGYRVI